MRQIHRLGLRTTIRQSCMRVGVVCLALIWTTVATFSDRVSAETPAEAAVVQEPVFVSGTEGYHTFRIPSVLVTKAGTVLAFCEGRKNGRGDSGNIDLVLKRSEDGGRTFGPLQVVWDDEGNTCGNPCPVQDPTTNRIFLFMTHNLGEDHESEIIAKTSKGTRTVWLSTSDDDGRTWTTPVDLTESLKRPDWTWYATGPGCGIAMRSGRLVIPCDHIVADTKDRGSHIIYSDDHGKTWHLGGSVEPAWNECEAVELSDGGLLLNMRNYDRTKTCRAVAVSRDGGMTWSPVRFDESLPEPICQASIRRYRFPSAEQAGVVLFSNPADSHARVRMTLRASLDDCRTWPAKLVLWEGPSAYSCLAVRDDGTILCLYERGKSHPYETITLARVPLSAVLGGTESRARSPLEAMPTAAETPPSDRIVVRPKPTDAILANPDVGWETFHHTADNDRNLPEGIPSTIYYLRWGWGTLEPERGRIDTALVDRELAAARKAGQKLAFRVMCCSTYRQQPYHPDWLEKIGGRVVTTRYGASPLPLEVPDLDDPVVLEAHLDFIRRLGKRYDGHPDISHIDLGSVGWWGEWHMSQSSSLGMPSPETQRRIVDTYLESFRKTPLLMLIGGGEMLAYAVRHGCGWRADCLGDLGGFSRSWCHMRKGYPGWLVAADALDAWKRAPVAFETCWDIRKWVDEGWSLRYIFNYALAVHASAINNKSAPLPEGENVRAEVERFLRRLGYRFVLEEASYPAVATPDNTLDIAMRWRNVGSAPCYRPYHVAFRLRPLDRQGNATVHATEITVNDWMPGEVEVFTESFLENPPDLPPGPPVECQAEIPLPATLPAGSYSLDIGIVDNTITPVVQLGIEGRLSDGWYRLGDVRIVR